MKKISFFLLSTTLLFFSFSKKYVFAYTYEKTIPPVKVVDPKRIPPYGKKVTHPQVIPPESFSNDIKNKANQFICPINFTIQQTFPPTPCRDDDGNIIEGCFIPYDVFKVTEKKEIKELSNSNSRDDTTNGLHPYIDLYPTPGKKNKNLAQLDQNGYGMAYRITTPEQQLVLKGQFLEDAVASINQQKDTVVIDEQLAWDCAGSCKNLFNSDGSQPSGCRAVYVSEIACFFNTKKKQSTSYKWEKGKPVKIPFPLSLSGCTAPLSEKCYQTLYDNMPFISRGTVNTLLPIYNKKGGAFIEPTPYDRGFPLMAASAQMGNIAKILMPADQKIEKTPSSAICSNLEKQDSIQDKPSPVSWESFSSEFFFGTVYNVARTFKDNLKAEAIFPKTIIDNIDIDKTFLLNFLPYKDPKTKKETKKIINEISESSTADEPGFTYPDPGYKDSVLRKMFKDMLTPKSWHENK